ncbi:dehydrogenase [Candidatus Berkelbacteria bacterium CG06_land_8_20_14_3_00_43_10]|nr:MAG: dehydrogenase [Candidatus Berkelbacteria bacterium CG06_land_8_20_14_3_00_43_10]
MNTGAIKPSTLITLYTDMVRIRTIEEALAQKVTAGEIKCPVHLYSGQEAAAAGVCHALKKTDYVYGNHRSHGYYIAKGGDIPSFIAELYGKETGCSYGRGGSMHIIDLNVNVMGTSAMIAGTIPLAVGTALGIQLKNKKDVVVSFFGDSAAEEGTFYESLNFASIHSLPIIFVVENNLYAQHMHILERKSHDRIADIGTHFRIPFSIIDGNDVGIVYQAAMDAVHRVRAREGPAIIECLTYRLRGHVGAIDKVSGTSITDIRDIKEIEYWKKHDPISVFHKKYAKVCALDQTKIISIQNKIDTELNKAFDFAHTSPYPKSSTLTHYVYA